MIDVADSVRLNRTLAHIEANLGSWDQRHWVTQTACGTAYCFAGWALVLEGIRICADDCDDLGGYHVHRNELPSSVWERVPNCNSILAVAQVARVVLDLTPPQSWDLFCGGNTLQDLQVRVRNLTQPSREEQPR